MSAPVDEVILRVRSSEATAGDVIALVEPIVKAHAAIVLRGGFSNPERTDGAPELTFTVDGRPDDRRYNARARFVDRGAWRVLLDALRGELWLKNLSDHSDVQCSLVTDTGEALGSVDIEALPYPLSPHRVPFQMSWIEDGPPLRAGLRVFFSDTLTPATVDEVTQFLDDWQRLIRGYRPLDEPEVRFGGAIPTEAQWTQPYEVELALEAFVADESVFHPVVNFACWLQRRRVAIEELEID